MDATNEKPYDEHAFSHIPKAFNKGFIVGTGKILPYECKDFKHYPLEFL
jgi:hypothetical protein